MPSYIEFTHEIEWVIGQLISPLVSVGWQHVWFCQDFYLWRFESRFVKEFKVNSVQENACKSFCLCKHSIELKSWVFCSEILQTSWEFRFLPMHLCFTMDSNPVWIGSLSESEIKISVLQFYLFWSGIKIFIPLSFYNIYSMYLWLEGVP